MFINTTPAAQVQQFKQILGGVHQELFKLLERRGLTGELPENGPKGLRTQNSKSRDVKNLGTDGYCEFCEYCGGAEYCNNCGPAGDCVCECCNNQ